MSSDIGLRSDTALGEAAPGSTVLGENMFADASLAENALAGSGLADTHLRSTTPVAGSDADQFDVDDELHVPPRFTIDDPEASATFAAATEGQRRLAFHLNDTMHDTAAVLHSRSLPGTRLSIDHIVVGPTGVWVIDTRSGAGTVEPRDLVVQGLRTHKLYISGVDDSPLVDELEWQVAAIRRALEPVGFGGAPVSSALCFTDADWPFFAKPFQVRGVWVTWAKRLSELMLADEMFSSDAIGVVTEQLSTQLVALPDIAR